MTRKLRPYDEPPPVRRPLVPSTPDSAATASLVVAVLWLLAASGIGALAAAQQLLPDQLTATFDVSIGSGISIVVSRATTLPGFVDAVVFGWLSNAAFAAIFFMTPRLTGVRLRGEALAMLGLAAWNVAVAAGVALLYVKGASGPAALAEFPLPVQALAVLGLLAINATFWLAIAEARSIRFISLLYAGVGLLALLGLTALAAVPNVVSLGESNNLLLWAFTARATETYWVIGAAFAALYYVIPRVTGNPIYSSGLAYLAFAGWLAFAGLSAVGALIDPSVPYWITSFGQTGTLLLIAPTLLAVANLLGTMGGRWSLFFGPGPTPLAITALVFLSGSALLESVGALRGVRDLVAGTDWSLGVWLLVELGGATFALYAIAEHAMPRLLHRGWRGGYLSELQLWMTLVGVGLAGLASIGGGLIAGSLTVQQASPDQIDSTVLLFRLVTLGGLGLVALGALSMLVNLFLLYTSGQPAGRSASELDATAAAGH
jgi:cytochrome c oxidase cbb3-type subunit I